MPDSTSSEREWVTVKSTLPVSPYSPMDSRPSITTARLIVRPLVESDFDTVYILHSTPEVMLWSSSGLPNDLSTTRKAFDTCMPPNDIITLQYAICLRDTGEMIGTGGSHRREGVLGWPAFNYMFRKEFWGRGYATEFLKAFLDMWWSLPRVEAEVTIETNTVRGDGEIKEEMITADTQFNNFASQNVLQKNGLRFAKVFSVNSSSKPERLIVMHGFAGTKSQTQPT